MWNASAVRAPPRTSQWIVRPARQRVRGRLEHHDAGALAEDEAVAVRSNGREARVGSSLRLRQGAHVAQRRERDRQERRLRAADQHHVALAVLDQPQPVEERDDGAGAGRDLGDDRAGECRTSSRPGRRPWSPRGPGWRTGETWPGPFSARTASRR